MANKWFRFFALAAIAVCLTLICQNCSPPPGSHPVTLKLSGWGASPAEQHLLQQVLQSFEAKHPSIKVKFEVIADQYMDVIKTRLIGDAAPDVFYLEAVEAPFLMDKNVLEPLDRYISSEFDLPDFEENLLKPFKFQNQIYGLPKDYSTLALFYNKAAFAAAGLTQPPATWDELLADAKQLTVDRNQDGKTDQYGFGVLPDLPRLVYTLKAFGGAAVDPQGYAAFASDAALQGLGLTVDQYHRDRTSAQASDVGTNSGSEMFGQAKAAMVIEGNWAIPFLKETFPELEFATAEVPQMNNRPGTMVFTVGYVMNRQTQHKQAAWELISYLTGKEGMAQWTGTGFALPSRKSVAEKLKVDQDPLRSALVAGVSYATPWQAGSYPTAITTHFDNQFTSAMLGQQPLQPAMLRAQADANAQIKAAE
jgi:multiple sugar transport system substrate-binding protein